MEQTARKRATFADLESVPETLVGELIDGELITSPRPAPRHGAASSTLGQELGGSFQRGRGGPGGWWNLDEPELHLHQDALVPDLAGWRVARLPELPETAHFTLVPDWVCEVVSPGSEATDRVRKMPIYAREGVRHLWLVNPATKTLEVYRLENGRWSLIGTHANSERIRAEPFDAIELELGALWSGPVTP